MQSLPNCRHVGQRNDNDDRKRSEIAKEDIEGDDK
jgi:hypothetical protein